ncbi:hypothetical protein Tco_0647150, partial [Tanacetum coccineum]
MTPDHLVSFFMVALMSIHCFDRVEIICILARQLSTVSAMADVSFSSIVSLSQQLRWFRSESEVEIDKINVT